MEKGQQLDLFDELPFYEGNQVEYKGAKGGLPGSLWETYSAFANTDGGWIWLGITQREDGELDKHGVWETDKKLSDFWSTVHSNKVSTNLVSARDVEVLENNGRCFVRIHVPRAGRRERPVYIGLDPYKGTFRRDHDGDFLCTREEVSRMFADRNIEEPADSWIVEGFGMADLDHRSVTQYRNLLFSRSPHDPWLAQDDQGLLTKLGGWRMERRTGKQGLTVAGLLMFGRTDTITSPEALPTFHLDYREHFTDDPDIRWTDRITNDGAWEGNLFQFYLRVMQRLRTGHGLSHPFSLDEEGGRRSSTPVHEALQEALVNALIHADHRGQGGVVIDRWSDKFIFSNPGTLLLSREQLLKGGISECRNKYLQRMFQKLGIGDKAGSGLDKIRHSWSRQHWLSPQLGETHRPDRVELLLPLISMLPEQIVEALKERFGENLGQLGNEELQTVVAATMGDSITNRQLQNVLALHRVDITKMLQGLVRSGFLISEGTGRGTYYRVTGGPMPEVELGGVYGADDQKHKADLDTSNLPTVKLNLPTVKLDQRLGSGKELQGRPYRSRDDLRQSILELTKNAYRTAKELADEVGLGLSRVRQVIYEMKEDGLLESRTSRPRDPRQAYRAVEGIKGTRGTRMGNK